MMRSVQDRWTTIVSRCRAGPLRAFERLLPEQRRSNRFLPTAVIFPAEDGPSTRRTDAAGRPSYDVFGTEDGAQVLHRRYVTTFKTVTSGRLQPAGILAFQSTASEVERLEISVGTPPR